MQQEKVADRKDILIVSIFFLVAFLIRVAGVSNVVILWDEWLYQLRTYEILANSWTPSATIFEGPSPFLSYLAAIVTVLFGGELGTLRMLSVITGSLTVPLIYLFGKVIYDRNTGLLAASFLCFSAYHCMYSRVIMLEAFTLFFITAFLYFFWLSQKSEGWVGMFYAIIAGTMLGLAIDTKYLPAFLIPAILAYTFWIKRSLRVLIMDKRIILVIVFAFLLFLPMIVCFYITGANPLHFFLGSKYGQSATKVGRGIEQFEAGIGGGKSLGVTIPFSQLFLRAIEKITEVLSWGSEVLPPLWTVLFKLSVILIFLMTIIYYTYRTIKRERENSFLLISVLVLFVSLYLFSTLAKYYLMYLFSFYFVMLSHLAVESFNRIKKGNPNIFRIFIILLTTITLFSYLFTGTTSMYWDEGEELSWVEDAIKFIENDITKNGYEGKILIGLADGMPKKVKYILYKSNLNAKIVRITKPRVTYTEIVEYIDLKAINDLKPSYLIVGDVQYAIQFTKKVNKEILKNYTIVFHSSTFYPYNGLVLKRKDVKFNYSILFRSGNEGSISSGIFKGSLPSVMKLGNVYTVLVQVKNVDDLGRRFVVEMHHDKDLTEAIFIKSPYRKIYLDKNSIYMFKFIVVPIGKYTGNGRITVDLYMESEDGIKKVDSVSDYIYLIAK